MRLAQIEHPGEGARVAIVDGDTLRLLSRRHSVHAAALAASRAGTSLAKIASDDLSGETLEYDPIYEGRSQWRLLPPLTHPECTARCMVSGTGLTHRRSAATRQAMHASPAGAQPPTGATGAEAGEISDSMRMYLWGEEGGRPAPGQVGVPPEWFYKGTGATLRAHREPLEVPAYAEDGGEEAEVAGLYVIDDGGMPLRIGFAQGNEFSDHRMERRNYLFLAPSKLRECALGPELVVGGDFGDVGGRAWIERAGSEVWSAPIATGEAYMVHSLANIEHHHFKYAAHRQPGDAHVHFFGAGAFSFGSGLTLEAGDEMVIAAEGFGRPLRNRLTVDRVEEGLIAVRPL